MLQMVLPSSSTNFTTDCLRSLACLLGTDPVFCQPWIEAANTLLDLADDVIELYFGVGHDHFVLGGGDEDGEPAVPGHLLVLVLFLQGVGRRKMVGQKRERKTNERGRERKRGEKR